MMSRPAGSLDAAAGSACSIPPASPQRPAPNAVEFFRKLRLSTETGLPGVSLFMTCSPRRGELYQGQQREWPDSDDERYARGARLWHDDAALMRPRSCTVCFGMFSTHCGNW